MIQRISARRETILLLLILALGAALRLNGLQWDGGHWLHPDERQIYFVTLDLNWPTSWPEALSIASPLNPGFFAYGSLPFYLLRVFSLLLAPLWPAIRDADNLHLAGRTLATLFDVGTIYLTYRLAGTQFPEHESADSAHPRPLRAGPLMAATLMSVAMLPVQLAHFYTVDPLLTFFVMLTLNLAGGMNQHASWPRRAMLGAAFGLAMATKVSAAPLIVVVLLALSRADTGHHVRVPQMIRRTAFALAIAGMTFILTQPYALIDWKTFLSDTARESQIAWGILDVPYTRQYAGTLPYLYSIRQTSLWALVVPVGILAWAGLAASLIRWLRRAPWIDTLLLSWAGPYLAFTGLLHTRYLRYMLPLLPVLCILGSHLLEEILHRLGRSSEPGVKHTTSRLLSHAPGSLLILASLFYAGVLLTSYRAPHSWIVASEWIYRHVPPGSTIAVEEWDLTLPLPLELEGKSRRIEEYQVRVLQLYDEPDDATKWRLLATDLANSDYLVIASRRLYGSIPRLPERYPITIGYYDQLFAGNLGFELDREFTRGATWLNPRIPPLPDPASAFLHPDESFVVYDHPRTLIYRNAAHLTVDELLDRLHSP